MDDSYADVKLSATTAKKETVGSKPDSSREWGQAACDPGYLGIHVALVPPHALLTPHGVHRHRNSCQSE